MVAVGYVGQNIFNVGQHFTWVAWVKNILAWVKIFCVGRFFLRGSKFSARIKTFCGALTFCVGHFFGSGSNKSGLALLQ